MGCRAVVFITWLFSDGWIDYMSRLAFKAILILSTVLVVQAVTGAEQDELVSRAIVQLGANQYADREAASRQLAAMGVVAINQLTRAARGDDPELHGLRRVGPRARVHQVERRERHRAVPRGAARLLGGHLALGGRVEAQARGAAAGERRPAHDAVV